MLKAPFKLSLLMMWILLCIPPAWLAKVMHKTAARDRIVQCCYGGILRIIGIRLSVQGQMSNARPLLLVSNHVSYLDVIIMGSQPGVRFTPKSEIARWPLVGFICRLCECVFIDRRPEQVQEMGGRVQAALEGGAVISLFPEATTGDGLHLLPFKSGFFSLAEKGAGEKPLLVQPVAIAYTRLCRLPIDRTQWPQLAWYGDMDLAPHLLNLLTLGAIDAELTYLPPLSMAECGDRKQMAKAAQDAIAQALEASRSRRSQVTQAQPWKGLLLKRQGGG
jgi:1-acyl-sn-glycerol-3-phosphate acyltransferase